MCFYFRKLSPYFLVDYPFFWTVGERVDFIGKFYKLLKNRYFRYAFEQRHLSDQLFENWSEHFKGVYIKIWSKVIQAFRRSL